MYLFELWIDFIRSFLYL